MPELFDLARPRLERQYLDADFDPASGWSKDELVAALAQHRAECPDEPRILTRAWLCALLCTHAPIALEPDDYFADKLQHHGLLVALREEWRREEDRREFAGDPPAVPGAWTAQLDTGHLCPDWPALMREGLCGLRDRAMARDSAFDQAVALVHDAAIGLCRRFAARLPESPLAALAERPPETFAEALQLALLYHELLEMENAYCVRSMGRFDQVYNRFLVADLEAGRLTREQAKELLKYFWIKFYAQHQGRMYGKPFLFGPEVNELSYLAFEVYREMQVVDPKLHVRLGEATPQDFLEQVVDCIRAGCNGILIANDPAQVAMLQRNGKSLADARDYVLIGCYEPAVQGRELNCSGAASVNLAKVIELAMADDHATFDGFLSGYLRHLDEQLTRAIGRVRREERMWPRISPSPLLSGGMDCCFESGRDVSEAGARYNTGGCLSAGLANAVDSLAVVEQLVYQERRCTLAELRTALADNWQGHERLRLLARHRVPKWGNNDDRVDRFAVLLTDFLGRRINHEPNTRGGVFQAALYTILTTARDYGRVTGALPDGRLGGEPLTLNTGASVGMDQRGVTSLINSVTKIDLALFPNGTVLDIMLHPSVTQGPEGLRTICALIRSHFAQGGLALQFNIFDAALLRDAQQRPARYANLQVRVCGWNVRFVDLAPAEQELYIAKAEAA